MFILASAVGFSDAADLSFSSEDGELYALVSQESDGWYIYTESEEYGPFEDKVSFVQRKKDGSIFFGIYGSQEYVHIDDEAYGPFVCVSTAPFRFITDRFICVCMDPKNAEYFLFIDGKKSGPYNSATILSYTENKLFWMYTDLDRKKTHLMCEQTELECINGPVDGFSSKGFANEGLLSITLNLKNDRQTAYLLNEKGLVDKATLYKPSDYYMITHDQKPFGPFDEVSDFYFDEKGSLVFLVNYFERDDKTKDKNGPASVANGPVGVPLPPVHGETGTLIDKKLFIENKNGFAVEIQLPKEKDLTQIFDMRYNSEAVVFTAFCLDKFMLFVNGEMVDTQDYETIFLDRFTGDGNIILRVYGESYYGPAMLNMNDGKIYKINLVK